MLIYLRGCRKKTQYPYLNVTIHVQEHGLQDSGNKGVVGGWIPREVGVFLPGDDVPFQ